MELLDKYQIQIFFPLGRETHKYFVNVMSQHTGPFIETCYVKLQI